MSDRNARNKSEAELIETNLRQIKVFISYASEDSELVSGIVRVLNDTFMFAPITIFRDVEIKEGKNYMDSTISGPRP
jgi:hypothetical protein